MHILQTRIQNIEAEIDDTENAKDLILIETMQQAIQDIYDKYPDKLEIVTKDDELDDCS